MRKALIFDFDGVIVKSEPLHHRTFIEILAPFEVKISRRKWYEDFAGTGSRSIFRRLFAEYGIDGDIEEFIQKRRKLYVKYVKQGMLKPTQGLRRFLSKLGTGDWKSSIAIASGSHNSNIELILKQIGLDPYFDVIVGGNDVKKPKPDPEGFLLAAKMLGKKTNDCVVIEDSIRGAEAACRAGMKLVCFDSPIANRLNNSCIKIIHSYSEFPLELLD
jgi:HAD superfamily hydrolase (TIGR01509 family)